MKETLNCMGLACPLPVVKAKKTMEAFTEDGTLIVQVDNDAAVQNLTRLAGKKGFAVSSAQTGEKAYEVSIEVKAAGSADAGAAADTSPLVITACDTGAGRGSVVVLSSNKMGSGDDKLGTALMKAFLFALTNVDPIPETIIAYNSGVFLTTEGSEVLEDLKNLEAAGTKIVSCGTCLNFYGLTEKLAVGTVSNMYDIVELQNGAVRIIRP